jgi:hypothetical protein
MSPRKVESLEAWRDQPIDPGQLGVQDQAQLRNVVKTLRGVAQAREQRRRWRRVVATLAAAAGGARGGGGWLDRGS